MHTHTHTHAHTHTHTHKEINVILQTIRILIKTEQREGDIISLVSLIWEQSKRGGHEGSTGVIYINEADTLKSLHHRRVQFVWRGSWSRGILKGHPGDSG